MFNISTPNRHRKWWVTKPSKVGVGCIVNYNSQEADHVNGLITQCPEEEKLFKRSAMSLFF